MMKSPLRAARFLTALLLAGSAVFFTADAAASIASRVSRATGIAPPAPQVSTRQDRPATRQQVTRPTTNTTAQQAPASNANRNTAGRNSRTSSSNRTATTSSGNSRLTQNNRNSTPTVTTPAAPTTPTTTRPAAQQTTRQAQRAAARESVRGIGNRYYTSNGRTATPPPAPPADPDSVVHAPDAGYSSIEINDTTFSYEWPLWFVQNPPAAIAAALASNGRLSNGAEGSGEIAYTPGPTSGQVSITGRVYLQPQGQPLANWPVRIWQRRSVNDPRPIGYSNYTILPGIEGYNMWTLQTDHEGRFEINNLPDNYYFVISNLNVNGVHYNGYTRGYDLSVNEHHHFNVHVLRGSEILNGFPWYIDNRPIE